MHMARIARAAARGYLHPIPHRGKRRRGTFFGPAGSRAPCARPVKVPRGRRAAERPYDAQNRRIAKTVGQTATHFYFNESWQVLETRVGAGPNPLDQYLWDIRYIDAAVVRFHDADTNGSYENAGDNILYYTQDANFNTTALVDEATGDVAERYIYTAYGEAMCLDLNWANGQATSRVSNEILFTGHLLDAESGLVQARERDLHTTLGRWTSEDPRGYADTANVYEYVAGCAPNATDPLGEASLTVSRLNDPGIDLSKPIGGKRILGLTVVNPNDFKVTAKCVSGSGNTSRCDYEASAIIRYAYNKGLPSEEDVIKKAVKINWNKVRDRVEQAVDINGLSCRYGDVVHKESVEVTRENT
jgi:RHS repeat-associated protein